MSLLLHIDTSLELASIALSDENKVLDFTSNDNQQDHAAWIHTAIETLMKKTGHSLSELSAVSVTIGPGSYTGLRIGLSTAKGICYALKKPLITIPTLELIASTVNTIITEKTNDYPKEYMICPMIDARRMEVYTAVYDASLKIISDAKALILDPQSFEFELKEKAVFFCGNGVSKFKGICSHPNAHFVTGNITAGNMVSLAWQRFGTNEFADLAYSAPLYLKEFHTTAAKP